MSPTQERITAQATEACKTALNVTEQLVGLSLTPEGRRCVVVYFAGKDGEGARAHAMSMTAAVSLASDLAQLLDSPAGIKALVVESLEYADALKLRGAEVR